MGRRAALRGAGQMSGPESGAGSPGVVPVRPLPHRTLGALEISLRYLEMHESVRKAGCLCKLLHAESGLAYRYNNISQAAQEPRQIYCMGGDKTQPYSSVQDTTPG